jgi:hypothetical protein
LGDPAAAEEVLVRGYEATGDEAISILLGTAVSAAHPALWIILLIVE